MASKQHVDFDTAIQAAVQALDGSVPPGRPNGGALARAEEDSAIVASAAEALIELSLVDGLSSTVPAMQVYALGSMLRDRAQAVADYLSELERAVDRAPLLRAAQRPGRRKV